MNTAFFRILRKTVTEEMQLRLRLRGTRIFKGENDAAKLCLDGRENSGTDQFFQTSLVADQ